MLSTYFTIFFILIIFLVPSNNCYLNRIVFGFSIRPSKPWKKFFHLREESKESAISNSFHIFLCLEYFDGTCIFLNRLIYFFHADLANTLYQFF